MSKVYLLECSSGSFCDYEEWIEGIYASKELAEKAKLEFIDKISTERTGITDDFYDDIVGFLSIVDYDDEEKVLKEGFPELDYSKFKECERIKNIYGDYNSPTVREFKLINNLDELLKQINRYE